MSRNSKGNSEEKTDKEYLPLPQWNEGALPDLSLAGYLLPDINGTPAQIDPQELVAAEVRKPKLATRKPEAAEQTPQLLQEIANINDAPKNKTVPPFATRVEKTTQPSEALVYASLKPLAPTAAGSELIDPVKIEVKRAIFTPADELKARMGNFIPADYIIPQISSATAKDANIKADAIAGRAELKDGKEGDERLALEAIARESGIEVRTTDGRPLDPQRSYTFRSKDISAIETAEAVFKKSAEPEAERPKLAAAFTNAADNARTELKVSAEAKSELAAALEAAGKKDGMENDHDQARAIGQVLEKLGVIDAKKPGVYHDISSNDRHVMLNTVKGLKNLENAVNKALEDDLISNAEKLQITERYDSAVKLEVGNYKAIAKAEPGKS